MFSANLFNLSIYVRQCGNFHYHYLDVFMKGAWSQLQEFEDPELQELSKCLPHIVMRGKAPATIHRCFFEMEEMGVTKERN